jgi:pyrroline-5-carboxylate reductase
MIIRSVGFIGAGRVTRILLGGFNAAGVRLPEIVVSDANPEVLDRLSVQFPNVVAAGAESTKPAAQDLVILALHPPVMAAILAEIKSTLQPEAVVVSLAPKITLARLSELLGGVARVVRMIPNAPSIIGLGYNPVAYGEEMPAEDRAAVSQFFEPVGECPDVAESKLEGFALLTGMGPTYFWHQLQALRELAAEFGLDENDAVPALKSMVCGSARTLLESGLPPDEVMDLIPVKPLADEEAPIRQAYRDRLTALYAKIRP